MPHARRKLCKLSVAPVTLSNLRPANLMCCYIDCLSMMKCFSPPIRAKVIKFSN